MQHLGERKQQRERESPPTANGMRIKAYMKVKFMFDTLVELDRLHKIDARSKNGTPFGSFRVLNVFERLLVFKFMVFFS